MKLGYNTNGLASHRLEDAIELIAEIGYRSVAITIDHHALDPFSTQLAREIEKIRALLDRYGLISVVETGARFLLDPWHKHEPTLLSPAADQRQARVDFLKRCVDIAAELQAEAVSFFSGIQHAQVSKEQSLQSLAEGCIELIAHTERKNVKLAFEPEPGMFIETFSQYAQLLERVDAPYFGLTVDIGHVHCVEEGSIAGHLRTWAGRIFNVHIEDMRRGVHEHLRFGEGEIDFAPVLAALDEIGYTGGVNVELSRHSHMAPQVMRDSFDFLSHIRGRSRADSA
jgi:sugar phosphate isomerase/epimerase